HSGRRQAELNCSADHAPEFCNIFESSQKQRQNQYVKRSETDLSVDNSFTFVLTGFSLRAFIGPIIQNHPPRAEGETEAEYLTRHALGLRGERQHLAPAEIQMEPPPQ